MPTPTPLYLRQLLTSSGTIAGGSLQRPRALPAANTVELREAGQPTRSAADSAQVATVGEG